MPALDDKNTKLVTNSEATRALRIAQDYSRQSAETCQEIADCVQRAVMQGVKLQASDKPRKARPQYIH